MKTDAVRGHLDSLILAVVERGPLHGYAIIEALGAASGGRLAVPTGSVYPALRRLERNGQLRSSWRSVGGRDRRTYQLTAAGRAALARERESWQEFSGLISQVLLG